MTMNKELNQQIEAIKQLKDLGLPVSKEQSERLILAEKYYVDNELIPTIEEVIRPHISCLSQPLTLIVEYDPIQGIIIKNSRCGHEITMNSDIVLTHPVDWSPFEYGFTIDHKFHEAIFKAIGHYIPRGSGVNIKLYFEGKLYDAKITNANRQVKGDTIRLLYCGKHNNFGTRLKEELPELYDYLKQFKETNGGRSRCNIPIELRQRIALQKTAQPDVYNVLCFANEE